MNLTHNHQMVDEYHRFFMSNERNIPDDVKQRIALLRRAGVDVPTIRAILKEEFGDCVTWVYNDIYNFIYQLEGSGSEKKEFDAEEFIKVLEQFKYDNDEFFYYIDINNNTQRLERVIWMFPEQRINYSRFNDIVVFDNTYKTNRFQMPSGIFTGVNNYGHSICFASVLMIDETEDNFIWVFTKFLEMVNQHAPLVILTDDDRAMANAYSKVLRPLGTKYRLCQWHLMKNVMKNLSAKLGNKWTSFINDLYKCFGEMDISKFLSQWDVIKTSYPLTSTYLSRMEKTKEKWAACFNCNVFMADMTTTQCGESMNNMMKGYLDASTSLLTFITAFQSALDAQIEKTEFYVYQQDNFNVLYKTISPFERQAVSILTTYSLKKTQEQLMQSFTYSCENISSQENNAELIFQVQRFEKETNGRIVKYNSNSNCFTCSCGYTQFSGFICRHIFRTAVQLNLKELPTSLFYERWKKNPSEENLINAYINFSTSPTSQQLSNNQSNDDQDQNHQYMLTRLLQKIQRFVTQNPIISKTLYISFNEIFTSEVENLNKAQSKVQSNTLNIIPTVKNPLVVHGKGHPSNKRIKSAGELTDKSNNKKKKKTDENTNNNNMSENIGFDNCEPIYITQNIQPLHEIQNLTTLSQHCTLPSPQVPHFDEPDFLSNKLNLESACTIVEQYEFCLVHKGEGTIIPCGIEKGYPLYIDFAKLPNRITELKSDLLKIIKGQRYSEFRVDAVKRIQEIGKSKVDHPLYQINYFESFQPGYYEPKGLEVISKTLIEMFAQPRILTENLCAPQSSSQYLVQVLVPETAIRLIAEDLGGIPLNMAKNVMNDSVEFGFYVHKDSNT
ncbi:unnamed protein product [Rhizophagus irregularis]|nr:unnamed protein product [Rhizophagus irregularis]